jgi:hypothetical protein
MEPLPYLGELLSLNIKSVREAKALLISLQRVTHDIKYNHFVFKPNYITKYKGCLACNRISTVFGEFEDSWNKYNERNITSLYGKNGIEILNAEPNATGRTYSNKCRITVKELKEACKANGLKVTGDKKTLLHSLMKI